MTSATSGEGKGFVSVNLALSLTMTGKKVVLIQLNSMHPSLSPLPFGEGQIGISDYLMDNINPTIVKTDLNKMLYFIPFGSTQIKEEEEFYIQKLETLLLTLDKQFDYILINCSSLKSSKMAYSFSRLCDITLFIIRHGYTPKALLNRLEEGDEINLLGHIGIIYNAVKHGWFKSKYGSGYGYNYGYGSGYEDNFKYGDKKTSQGKPTTKK